MGQFNIKVGPLDKASYKYYLKRDGKVQCRNCPTSHLKVGDVVVRKKTNNTTYLYHLECAEKLWII